MWLAKGVSLWRLQPFQEEVFTHHRSLHPWLWSWETTTSANRLVVIERLHRCFCFFPVGWSSLRPSGLTPARSLNPEAPPRNNRLASAGIPALSVRLCRPSLPSPCNYVPACRKAVFQPLPLRRVPGWPPNLRGPVRQTGRQQGWKSGCVRVESRSGCDGHQIWERSSPGGSKKEAAGFEGPCLDQILWKCVYAHSRVGTLGITALALVLTPVCKCSNLIKNVNMMN